MSGKKTSSTRVHRRLWLYKQQGSPNWYARVTYGRVTKAKSTGTTDLKLANERAEAFFYRRLTECSRGESAATDPRQHHRRFDRLVDDFLDIKRADLSDYEWRNLRNLLTSSNGPASYFHGKDVGDITTDGLRTYLRYAETHSRKGKLSGFTLNRHLSAVSGVLRLGKERQLIATVPEMPRVKTKDAPRSYFTQSEYRRLCSTAHSLAQRAQKANDARSAAEWDEIGDLVAFLLNTFLRPSEWTHLRQRDVAVTRSEPTPHLNIALKGGKTGARPVVTMPAAVRVYDRMVARNGSNPEAYLFFRQYLNRETATEKAGRLFRQLLDETGLRIDPFGRARSLYCLRHSALMLRLLKSDGLDLLTLAKAAGTSVAMLERFYLSHHAPAMKLAALQSFRRHEQGEKSSPRSESPDD